MEMVVVRTVATRFEAELLAAKLGAHGVLWEIRSRQLVPTTHPIGFLDVMVPVQESELAEEVLTPDEHVFDDLTGASVDQDPEGAADDAGAPGAPARGLSPTVRTLRILLGVGLLVTVAAFLGAWLVDLFRFLDVVH